MEREKIIEALRICSRSITGPRNCMKCPYQDLVACQSRMMQDAAALIEEEDNERGTTGEGPEAAL